MPACGRKRARAGGGRAGGRASAAAAAHSDDDESDDEEITAAQQAEDEKLLIPIPKLCPFLMRPYATVTARAAVAAAAAAAAGSAAGPSTAPQPAVAAAVVAPKPPGSVSYECHMSYDHDGKGVPGLEQLLHVLVRAELEAVAEDLGIDAEEVATKAGRKKDKRTNEWKPCTVRFSPAGGEWVCGPPHVRGVL